VLTVWPFAASGDNGGPASATDCARLVWVEEGLRGHLQERRAHSQIDAESRWGAICADLRRRSWHLDGPEPNIRRKPLIRLE
jgi:hypothetical protein